MFYIYVIIFLNKLKVVIVDDEPKAIQGLSWEPTNISDEIEIVKPFSIPEDALDYFSKSLPKKYVD